MRSTYRGCNQNVYLDVSLWQERLRRDPLNFYRDVREIMDVVGDRLMWATDTVGPGTFPVGSYLAAFRHLPASVRAAGIDFSAQELSAFLGGTAAKLYRLGDTNPLNGH